MFYQGVPIYHCTHVTGPFAQSSSETDYNIECTSGMALAHFRMLNKEFLNKETGLVPEQSQLTTLDSK